MTEIISNILCFIVGKPGSGKSHSLNYILHKELQMKRRAGIVILDLRADHINLIKTSEEFFYLKISPRILNNYKLNWAGILAKYPYVVIEPFKMSRDEYMELTERVAQGVLDVENRILVIEEAQMAMPVNSGIRRNMSAIITSGRKLGIDVYFTSQRPALVDTTAVSEANTRIVFSMDDVNDLKRIKPYVLGEKIETLDRFQFVAINNFTHNKIRSDTYHLETLDKIIWGQGTINTGPNEKE